MLLYIKRTEYIFALKSRKSVSFNFFHLESPYDPRKWTSQSENSSSYTSKNTLELSNKHLPESEDGQQCLPQHPFCHYLSKYAAVNEKPIN